MHKTPNTNEGLRSLTSNAINVVPINCSQFINNFKTQWKIEN